MLIPAPITALALSAEDGGSACGDGSHGLSLGGDGAMRTQVAPSARANDGAEVDSGKHGSPFGRWCRSENEIEWTDDFADRVR